MHPVVLEVAGVVPQVLGVLGRVPREGIILLPDGAPLATTDLLHQVVGLEHRAIGEVGAIPLFDQLVIGVEGALLAAHQAMALGDAPLGVIGTAVVGEVTNQVFGGPDRGLVVLDLHVLLRQLSERGGAELALGVLVGELVEGIEGLARLLHPRVLPDQRVQRVVGPGTRRPLLDQELEHLDGALVVPVVLIEGPQMPRGIIREAAIRVALQQGAMGPFPVAERIGEELGDVPVVEQGVVGERRIGEAIEECFVGRDRGLDFSLLLELTARIARGGSVVVLVVGREPGRQ